MAAHALASQLQQKLVTPQAHTRPQSLLVPPPASCSTAFQAQTSFPSRQHAQERQSRSRLGVALAEEVDTRPASMSIPMSATPMSATSFSSMMDDDDEYEEGEYMEVQAEQEVDESLLVANLGLSAPTMTALAKRNIYSLFPIQLAVYEPINAGRDVVGRAKTGSGKTLAFALPVVESLLQENIESPPKRGRTPRALIMAPTRELANQVAKEFQSICPSLVVESVYGGTSIVPQLKALERGADVVVGTPGRIIDLLERRTLNLEKVRFSILDEADQMLDMGFEEDMENILSKCPEERQTLLFSATLPKWVAKVAKKYQRNPLTIDLVGEENMNKLNDAITLYVMQVENSEKVSALSDLLSVYAAGGKAIIFVNTKAKADDITMGINSFIPAEALHGDIAQAQREKSLQAFRDGKFSVLVATDVAARGLDIPNVELVIHFDVPQDQEAFLHRSGRTGRGGKTGTAILLFTERDAKSVGLILQASKVKNVKLIGSPEPADIMRTAAKTVLNKLDKVDPEVIDFFVPAAERLLAGDQPSQVLAAALACMSGFKNAPQARSLLTYELGSVTLRMLTTPGRVDGYQSLVKMLTTIMTKAGVNAKSLSVGKIKLLENQENGLSGAAFDTTPQLSSLLLERCQSACESLGVAIDKPKMLELDIGEMLVGGRRSPPRAERGSSRFGGRDGGRDRDFGRGRDRDFGRGRDRRDGGSWSGGAGSNGRRDDRGGSWGARDGGSRSGGGARRGGGASRGGDRWSDGAYDNNGYFENGSRGGAGKGGKDAWGW